MVPALQIKFPEHELLVDIHTVENPKLGFTENGKVIDAPCEMDWYAIDPKTNEKKKAFTLIGHFDSKATATLKGHRLVPVLKFLKQDFKLKSTEIGDFSVAPLNYIFNFAFDNGIVPYVNNFVKDGYPIPTIPDLELVNPELTFESKYLVVSTDVRYKGDLLEDSRSK